MHQPSSLLGIVRRARMKHSTVIPQYGIADPPAMPVLKGRLAGMSGQVRDKRPRIFLALTDDSDGDL